MQILYPIVFHQTFDILAKLLFHLTAFKVIPRQAYIIDGGTSVAQENPPTPANISTIVTGHAIVTVSMTECLKSLTYWANYRLTK